jgi:hypothetical protein
LGEVLALLARAADVALGHRHLLDAVLDEEVLQLLLHLRIGRYVGTHPAFHDRLGPVLKDHPSGDLSTAEGREGGRSPVSGRMCTSSNEIIANSTTAAQQNPLRHKGVNPEANGPWLPLSCQNTIITPALASGQIPRAKPVRDWKKPTVEKISKAKKAKSDLEDLYARVSPLLSDHPAGAKYFSDELRRILEVLGRLKMTLASPDLPERTLTIRACWERNPESVDRSRLPMAA